MGRKRGGLRLHSHVHIPSISFLYGDPPSLRTSPPPGDRKVNRVSILPSPLLWLTSPSSSSSAAAVALELSKEKVRSAPPIRARLN